MGAIYNLGRNTFWVFIGNIGSKFIGLLMLPFYTHWLSVEDYGTTDVIMVYAMLLMSIVGMCLPEAIFIFPKGQERKCQQQYFTSGFIGSIVLFIITLFLFIVIKYLSPIFNWESSFIEYLWWIYIFLFTAFVQQYLQQFCRSIDKMRVYSFAGIIQTISTASLSFLLIPRYGVYGFMSSQISACIVTIFYILFASRSYNYYSFHSFSTDKLKEMFVFAIPLIPNGILWWLVSALNRPIMEGYLGLHAIGIFAVANKFPALLSMLFSVFMSAWQISVIEEFKTDNYKSFYNKVFKQLVNFSFFIFVLITLFSCNLVSLLSAENFADAAIYIPLLTLGALFSGVSTVIGGNFSATRESKYYFYSSIWGALVSILANFCLIPILHIWGAVLSLVVSFAVIMLIRNKYASKYVVVENKSYYFIVLLMCGCLVLSSLLLSQYVQFMIGFLFIMIVLYLNRNDVRNIICLLKLKI